MRAFEAGLHLGELMLHSIQLNTCLLTRLAHFAYFFFFLPQLQIHTFVLIRKLLRESVLEGHHQHMVCRQECFTAVVEILVNVFLLLVLILVTVSIVILV